MSNIGVSIIIPCHNAGEDIEKAVASAYKHRIQTDFEVIVYDDGSTDGETFAALKKVEEAGYPNLTIIRSPQNIGQSNARNEAMKRAQYKYILPLDGDDELSADPYLLEQYGSYPDRAVAALEKDNQLALVYSEGQFIGKKSGLLLNAPYREKRILLQNAIPVFGIFRRDEALEMGGYDPDMNVAEDWGFWIALLNQRMEKGLGRKVLKLEEPYYLYRQHEHSRNVNARPVNARQLFPIILKRAEAIYAHNFPDVPRSDLVDYLVSLREQQHKFQNQFSAAVSNAIQSPLWAMRRVFRKLENIAKSWMP